MCVYRARMCVHLFLGEAWSDLPGGAQQKRLQEKPFRGREIGEWRGLRVRGVGSALLTSGVEVLARVARSRCLCVSADKQA